jgi:hypothetical protein
MIAKRSWLIAIGLPVLIGCQPVPQKTYSYRKPETAAVKVDAIPLKASDDPQVVLERVITAYGGPEKCARWRAGHIKYTATLKGVDTIVEEFFEFPGKFKRIVSAKADEKEVMNLTFVINRDEAWMLEPGGRVTPMAETSFANRAEHIFDGFCNPTRYKEDSCELSILGEKDIRGQATVHLSVVSLAKKKVGFLFIDKSSGLIVSTEGTIPKWISKEEGDAETYFSDYRDFEGTKVPTRIMLESNGKVIFAIAIQELEFLDRVDDKVFAKP